MNNILLAIIEYCCTDYWPFWLCDSKQFNYYIKKSPCTYVYQYPTLRHGPSKIKYKLVLVCGQNITHYFYSSFSVLHIYLYLINLHLIIDYTHFYYYIPFWIFYFAESLNSRWDLSGASFPFQYLNSSHMGVYQSSGLSG